MVMTEFEGVCDCVVFGPGIQGYDNTASTYTSSSVVGGEGYSFKARFLHNGNVISESQLYKYHAKKFSPTNVQISKLQSASNTVNVTWDAPGFLDGTLNGYRVCYCAASTVSNPDECTCPFENSTVVPYSGVTRQTWAQVPEIGTSNTLENEEVYYFVVEVEYFNSALNAIEKDGSLVATMSIPFFAPKTSSSAAANSTVAGILTPLLLVLFILVGFIIFMYRRNRRRLNEVRAESLTEKSQLTREFTTKIHRLEARPPPVLPTVTLQMISDKVFSGEPSAARNPYEVGFWDYHAQERAEQFLTVKRLETARGEPTIDSSTVDAHEHHDEPTVMEGRRLSQNISRLSDSALVKNVDRVSLLRRRNQISKAFIGEAQSDGALPAEGLKTKVMTLLRSGALSKEFDRFQDDAVLPDSAFQDGNESYNYRKNRFGNVLPLDATRVRLAPSGQLGSDYINANYVDGWKLPHAYIATQAPIPSTVGDFWRMVWESDSGIIIKATKEMEQGKTRCHRYWPENNTTIQSGLFEIAWISHDEPSVHYSVRKMVLTHTKLTQSRDITQINLNWPDQGIPESAAGLLQVVKAAGELFHDGLRQNRGVGPVIVHDSAGVGRTGVIVATDISLRRLAEIGNVDVPATVSHMRLQRAGAVQNVEQYQFIYEAIALAQGKSESKSGAATSEREPLRQDKFAASGVSQTDYRMIQQLAGDEQYEDGENLDNDLIAALNRM